ncbi:uncharacterized protein N7473_001807 [Penicillium subrubescens]|uniref:uncharacterized protein n=1 Tax=Penicillium subrubescens TaxID=1316194 RepID=UPI002544E748|nr:uncharacterized protein N7473_001807 [Penicillium subrubescens]KAJ5904891.1 hypothetical protein N7473_001807 [Penicillium subrubescens]
MARYHHNRELPQDAIFPVNLRLNIIKSKIYRASYSFRSLQISEAELLKEACELNDALEKWRLSVPRKWRPTLSISRETPDSSLSVQTVMLRLSYYLCVTIIHAAITQCKALATDRSEVMDAVRSSLAFSVEASRSTLLYLETAEPVLSDGLFWTLAFYPMTAVLTIFCNILQIRSGDQAVKDLCLLERVTVIMDRVSLRQSPSINEKTHVKMVAAFVAELFLLARCAIAKANNERSDK